jgi:hypothetical protein
MKAHWLFALAAVSDPSIAAEAVPTLCSNQEVVAFSCSLGSKTVSLCSSQELTRESGTLSYRFGTPGHVELEFPRLPAHPKDNFRIGRVLYAGGGGVIVKFSLGAHTYSVYESFGGGNAPESRWANSGLTVRTDDKLLMRRECKRPHLGTREDAMDTVLRKAGIPEDARYSDEP